MDKHDSPSRALKQTSTATIENKERANEGKQLSNIIIHSSIHPYVSTVVSSTVLVSSLFFGDDPEESAYDNHWINK
jgi:hypothetical protein